MKKFLGCLLALLGFAGCESITTGGEEYGSPYVEFSIKGEVTDGENSIENVEVKLLSPYGLGVMQSKITDKDGKYSFPPDRIGLYDTLQIPIVADDLNNKYQSDTVKVTFVRSDYSGKKKNNEWFCGSAEKTVNFTLKKKDGK